MAAASAKVGTRACFTKAPPKLLSPKLPDDVIYLAFMFLSTKALCKAARTSRGFRDLCLEIRRLRSLQRLPQHPRAQFSSTRQALALLTARESARAAPTCREYAGAAKAVVQSSIIHEFAKTQALDLLGGRAFFERLPVYPRLAFQGNFREIPCTVLDHVQHTYGSMVLVADIHVEIPDTHTCAIIIFVNDKSAHLPVERFLDDGAHASTELGTFGHERFIAHSMCAILFNPQEMMAIYRSITPDHYTITTTLYRRPYDARVGTMDFFTRLIHQLPAGRPLNLSWSARLIETAYTVTEAHTTTTRRERTCCCGRGAETITTVRSAATLSLVEPPPTAAQPYMLPPPPAAAAAPAAPSAAAHRSRECCIIM